MIKTVEGQVNWAIRKMIFFWLIKQLNNYKDRLVFKQKVKDEWEIN